MFDAECDMLCILQLIYLLALICHGKNSRNINLYNGIMKCFFKKSYM